MSKRSPYRRPVTFKLDDANVVVTDPNEESRPSRGTIQVTPEDETPQLPVAIAPAILQAERRFRWGTVFWSAVGGLVLLGAGLGVAHLIEDLFARSDGLGILGLVLTFAATLSFLVVAAREAIGLMRLSTIEHLHRRAAAVILSDDRNESRDVLRDLLKIARANPRLARARATLSHHTGDIIDGADLIRVAERELMSPLDQEARFLISAAAQRVSLVTAISPRALFDVAFVLAASLRLIRQLALLYGGRPGTLGMIKLMRHVLAHLAITGGMAASDSVIQQVLGHGLAAKLSQRLGEGFLNGLLTARLGLAAIDLTRPLPFTALPRPSVTALAKDLLSKREDVSEP
jgi:putative membrane protein